MKETLINVLSILSEKRTYIVKEMLHEFIPTGAEVYANGLWCFWVRGHLERTLIHYEFTLEHNGEKFKSTVYEGLILMKIKMESS